MSPESAARWMERCLSLAARADSATSPNPRVGCVILSSEGQLLGEGWHRYAGGPHAEVEAISQARSNHGPSALVGATLVVNLEPCNHHGQTPPCTQSILDAGITHVVVGMRDPNSDATGGIAHLRSENVTVMTEVLKAECHRFNEAFVHWHATGLPFVTLKLAQTLDGCIATANGESQWITGKAARKRVHLWRRENDAVLIGSGTARKDNPSLTVRHISGSQPWRIVLDWSASLPQTLKLFGDEWAHKTIAVVADGTCPTYGNQLSQKGGHLIAFERSVNRSRLQVLLSILAKNYKIQSLFVEAGPQLTSALLQQNLVDRLQLFIAPKLIGNGMRSFTDIRVKNLSDSYIFPEHSWEIVGKDQLFTGYKHPVSG